LVIPALENRDWRAAARKRRAVGTFVPESAKAVTGSDGSVGGLGTRDTINSGPQNVGLVIKSRSEQAIGELDDEDQSNKEEDVSMVSEKPPKELTEDERALRAILQGDLAESTTQIDIIPSRGRTETEAYQEDVVTLPDSSTLADYERVPIEQFGAALLRGMGWKEGTAVSRTGKGPIEPYLPEARPSLLGIGAKERPPEDIPSGSSKKDGKRQRPDKKYIPLVMKTKDQVEDDRRYESSSPVPRSSSSSRRPSRSPPRRSQYDGRDDRDRNYDRDRSSSRRDSERLDGRRRDVDREKWDREYRDRDRDRHGDSYKSDKRRDRSKDHSRPPD